MEGLERESRERERETQGLRSYLERVERRESFERERRDERERERLEREDRGLHAEVRRVDLNADPSRLISENKQSETFFRSHIRFTCRYIVSCVALSVTYVNLFILINQILTMHPIGTL